MWGGDSGDYNIPAERWATCAQGLRARPAWNRAYLDHLMFTLSPATTQRSLAVSPSGTVIVDGSPVMVSSPGPEEEALLAAMWILPNLCHLTSKATGTVALPFRTAPYPEL